VLAPAAPATVGTSFPPGFDVPTDASLGVPVLGFGAAGPVVRTPVIFLHGNNDTPYPTSCNQPFGRISSFADYFLARGYAPGELWALGYQGDQCDLIGTPTNRSGEAHSTLANVPDLRRFVRAVLVVRNADTSFVYFSKQDGLIAPVPAENRRGEPHDFSLSARLRGAANLDVTGQGRYDDVLGSAHLGILNSPEVWQRAFEWLTAKKPSLLDP
jgi:hypothetical protein